MKLFSLATVIFLSPVCLGLCSIAGSLSAEDEICITEEALPKLPEKPQKQSPILIPALKGIIVVDSPDSLLPDENYGAISGVELIGQDFPGKTKVLKKNLTSFIGQNVSEDTLRDIKRTISNYYRQSGRPLVVIQAPEQNISKGILVLSVLESRVGKVRVEGNKWSSDKRLLEYFRLRPDQVINEGHLRNDVHFVNRNPFRRIDVIYAPGEESGTTDVILQAQENRSFRVYTGIDNTGVDPIGRGRYYAGFNWGNAFGLDHIMAYQYTRSLNINIFYAHTAE